MTKRLIRFYRSFFPQGEITISTALSPQEVESKLRNDIASSTGKFKGYIEKEAIALHMRFPGLFTFRVIHPGRIHGTIKSDDAGAQLHLTLHLYWYHLLFTGVWLTGIALWFICVPLVALDHSLNNPSNDGSTAYIVAAALTSLIAIAVFWLFGAGLLYFGKQLQRLSIFAASHRVKYALNELLNNP